MRPHRFLSAVTLSLAALASAGCARNGYPPTQVAGPPPPPPALYNQTPPLVALADHNGFETGRADGARDAYDGRPYRARSTRAYFDTPGYDRGLGPFEPYQNAFRNAYLRGYDRGFRRS